MPTGSVNLMTIGCGLGPVGSSECGLSGGVEKILTAAPVAGCTNSGTVTFSSRAKLFCPATADASTCSARL